MLAEEKRRRLAHRGQVQRHRHVPGPMPQQRVHRRAVPDKVPILFARRIETGMKSRVATRRRHHADVFRQPGVQGEDKLARRHFEFGLGNFDVRHHSQRMNAGVGATRAMNPQPGGE